MHIAWVQLSLENPPVTDRWSPMRPVAGWVPRLQQWVICRLIRAA